MYLELLQQLRQQPSNRGKTEQSTLLYLGDIARYRSRECMSNGPSKQCKAALEFYTAAVRAYPENGNPQNQLAVLATYVDNDIDAVYHYCRALTTRIPFETARDNLDRLYKKIIPKAQTREKLLRDILQKPTQDNQKKLRPWLCLCFLQFHGILNWKPSGDGDVGEYTTGMSRDLTKVLNYIKQLW